MGASSVLGIDSPARDRSRRWVIALTAAFWIALCVFPHVHRINDASLFSDDVTRIAILQTTPFKARLFRPFNEHVAPVFEVVTTLAWDLSGRHLTHAPMAFTLASFVPFVLILIALVVLVRRELESYTSAIAAALVFGVSSVYAEAIYWYSASSFSWALLCTIVVLIWSESASRAPAPLSCIGAIAAAALAPACSAIGMIAGPLGTIRILAANRLTTRKSLLAAFMPAAGTLLYLMLYLVFRPHDVFVTEGERRITIVDGLIAACRAPVEVLLPGLAGLRFDRPGLPIALILTLTALGFVVILWWALKSSARPLIVSAAGLIVGGYGLTYAVRGHHGPYWLLQVERYHLFPQAGMALLAVVAFHNWLRRADRRPLLRACLLAGLAAMMIARHYVPLHTATRKYQFPEERQTLAAFERLDELGRERGITRRQLLNVLDPMRTRWYPHDDNALAMLPDSCKSAVVPDASVRSVVLAALTAKEREAICGEMDASPYIRATSELAGDQRKAAAVGQLVATFAVRTQGKDAEYLPVSSNAFLEYHIQSSGSVRSLAIASGPHSRPLVILWTDSCGRWSPTRSARVTISAGPPVQDWSIPLDRLPHWGDAASRTIRIFPKSKGPIAVAAPRLLR
jgi:hypothetical protein